MVVARQAIYDVDGLTMVGHLARPDGEGPWPAVLIGHDGIGLEDYQRGRADILADRGYIVLAMDYHAGRTYFGEPEAMLARVMPLLADPGRMRAIGRTALEVLLAEPGADRERLAVDHRRHDRTPRCRTVHPLPLQGAGYQKSGINQPFAIAPVLDPGQQRRASRRRLRMAAHAQIIWGNSRENRS